MLRAGLPGLEACGRPCGAGQTTELGSVRGQRPSAGTPAEEARGSPPAAALGWAEPMGLLRKVPLERSSLAPPHSSIASGWFPAPRCPGLPAGDPTARRVETPRTAHRSVCGSGPHSAQLGRPSSSSPQGSAPNQQVRVPATGRGVSSCPVRGCLLEQPPWSHQLRSGQERFVA